MKWQRCAGWCINSAGGTSGSATSSMDVVLHGVRLCWEINSRTTDNVCVWMKTEHSLVLTRAAQSMCVSGHETQVWTQLGPMPQIETIVVFLHCGVCLKTTFSSFMRVKQSQKVFVSSARKTQLRFCTSFTWTSSKTLSVDLKEPF